MKAELFLNQITYHLLTILALVLATTDVYPGSAGSPIGFMVYGLGCMV